MQLKISFVIIIKQSFKVLAIGCSVFINKLWYWLQCLIICKGLLFFPSLERCSHSDTGGGKENNPGSSLFRGLNTPNHVLMSFVFKILYYPTVTFQDCALWLLFLRKVLGWRLGAQAGSASLLTFCLIGTEKSLKGSFQNSRVKSSSPKLFIRSEKCLLSSLRESYGAGNHKGVTEGSYSAQCGSEAPAQQEF